MPQPRRAFITGITGQDGSYLAELLLSLGYEVHGLVRQIAMEDPAHRMHRITHLLGDGGRLILHAASLDNYASLLRVLHQIKPDECYHLAAASFVATGFDEEFSTLSTNITGTHHLLAAVREAVPGCRFYFAGTSEMFGRVESSPQRESTRFHPRSTYGISKLAGYELTRNYRETHGLFAAAGILFNHESPRRGHEFVSRKITSHAARIRLGLADQVRLGDLDAQRDWGDARDYVLAMWLMLRQDEPGDYVIATGRLHCVRDLCDIAFRRVGLDWRDHVVIDSHFRRPPERVPLVGDASEARRRLGWQPTRNFRAMIEEMVDADLAHLRAATQGDGAQRRLAA